MRECQGQVVELTLPDGRQVRRHKDDVRHRRGEAQQENQEDGPEPSLQTPAETEEPQIPTNSDTAANSDDANVSVMAPTETQEEVYLRRSTRQRRPVDRYQAT